MCVGAVVGVVYERRDAVVLDYVVVCFDAVGVGACFFVGCFGLLVLCVYLGGERG